MGEPSTHKAWERLGVLLLLTVVTAAAFIAAAIAEWDSLSVLLGGTLMVQLALLIDLVLDLLERRARRDPGAVGRP